MKRLIGIGLAAAAIWSIAARAEAPALPGIVKRVSPAVVFINSGGSGAPQPTAPVDSANPDPNPSLPLPHSFGSGVVISGDGEVLTAAHLIKPGKITVRLMDGREFPATLAGIDRRVNVALLKIDAKSLAVAAMGDSSQVQPGETVFALGASGPAGHAQVTNGIVSTAAPGTGKSPGFIQTTAPLYPSMSGGPLFTMDGAVVGINVLIFAKTSNMVLSFAVPIDDALRTVAELRKRNAQGQNH